eukprot:gene31640-6835_t
MVVGKAAFRQVVAAKERDTVLAITSAGKAYRTQAYLIPEPKGSGYGTSVAQVLGTTSNVPLVALLPLPAEQVLAAKTSASNAALPPVGDDDDEADDGVGADDNEPFVLMLTQSGLVKKLRLTKQLLTINQGGLSVITSGLVKKLLGSFILMPTQSGLSGLVKKLLGSFILMLTQSGLVRRLRLTKQLLTINKGGLSVITSDLVKKLCLKK